MKGKNLFRTIYKRNENYIHIFIERYKIPAIKSFIGKYLSVINFHDYYLNSMSTVLRKFINANDTIQVINRSLKNECYLTSFTFNFTNIKYTFVCKFRKKSFYRIDYKNIWTESEFIMSNILYKFLATISALIYFFSSKEVEYNLKNIFPKKDIDDTINLKFKKIDRAETYIANVTKGKLLKLHRVTNYFKQKWLMLDVISIPDWDIYV